MYKRNTNEKRSPIKAEPLRSAGQSLDEEIHNIQAVEIGSYLTVSVCFFILAVFEWLKWFRNWPPQPLAVKVQDIDDPSLTVKRAKTSITLGKNYRPSCQVQR